MPALAFLDGKTRTWRIVEADASGEFPGQFTLDILEPPPADTEGLISDGSSVLDLFPDEARFTVGFVVALKPGYPKEFAQVVSHSRIPEPRCGADVPEEDCTSTTLTETWCTQLDVCYEETSTCDDDVCEVVSSEGDPAFKSNYLERWIEGVSENYAVVYMHEDPEPGSLVGHMLGGIEHKGYHLLRLGELSQAAQDEHIVCDNEACDQALAAFNERYDVDYTSYEAVSTGSELDGVVLPAQPEERLNELTVLRYRNKVEQGCTILNADIEAVPAGLAHPISLEMSETAQLPNELS